MSQIYTYLFDITPNLYADKGFSKTNALCYRIGLVVYDTCVSFSCHAIQEIDEERRDKEYVTYQERMMHNRRRIQVSSVYTMLR